MSLTEQQLAERHTGLGGSDAAPALGLSPFKSALELYLDKREKRDLTPELLGAIRWGTLLEPVIRQEYANATGRVVRMPTGTLRHDKHPWMLAHVDGITDDKRIFEAKTARSSAGWGAPGSADVPMHYALQVQHYMAVLGVAVADVAVLIGGSDFRVYEVPADPALQGDLIDGEFDFWRGVEKGEPPPPDFERDDAQHVMRRMYAGTDGRVLIAHEAEVNFFKAYEQAVDLAKTYERIAEGAKAHLLHHMGDASCLMFVDEGMRLVRKQVNRKEFVSPASTYVDARFSKTKDKETAE